MNPIETVVALDPGYSGHASDVWLVKTASGEAVVRSSRWKDQPLNDFWWGLNSLFGIDPGNPIHFEAASKMLSEIPTIAAPNILSRAEINGRPYLVVEKMAGHPMKSFTDQPDELLRQFGIWLAQVHGSTYAHFGNLAGTKAIGIQHFHRHLARTMERLVARYYKDSPDFVAALNRLLPETERLPAPSNASSVLIDIDPSQFLADDGRITAIVDLEAYVLGPRELDFIALEYVFDRKASVPFTQGYESVLPVPDLSEVREVYRFFYRLIGVQGSVELDKWFAQPDLF